MNKATAVALIGCLIVLIVYVSITSATLVRDIDATEADQSYPVETMGQSPALQPASDSAAAKKPALTDLQAKSFHKRHEHIAHRAKVKREPVILLL